MRREDLHRPARGENVVFEALPPILRVLLTTDGTVTDVLAAWFLEEVEAIDAEMAEEGEIVLRRVVLAGRGSGLRYVHAVSELRMDVLPREIRSALAASPRGIGQALRALGLATNRTVEDRWQERAGEKATLLRVRPHDVLVARRYLITLGDAAAVRIVERVPVSLFSDPPSQ
jgi:chorismate-pyruvate lyase